MTDTITVIRLGYGGGARLNDTYLLVTAGSMENSVTVSYTSSYEMPDDQTSRGRVLHADGTVTHTGSVTFDLTQDSLLAVKNILRRNVSFSIELFDGEYGKKMINCLASSISFSGSPSGTLNSTISFASALPSLNNSNTRQNRRDSFISGIIPYWWSGNSYVRDWTFTFNQQVTPKFLNKNSYLLLDQGILASSPLYLFSGEIDYSLDFTTFVPLITDKVHISNQEFKIVGRVINTGFVLGTQNELSTYKYNISSHAQGANDSGILTIL